MPDLPEVPATAIEAAVEAYWRAPEGCEHIKLWVDDRDACKPCEYATALAAALPHIEAAVRQNAARELLAAAADPQANLAHMTVDQAVAIICGPDVATARGEGNP